LIEGLVSNSIEVELYFKVLGWVLKKFSESIIDLTTEIAPYLESGIMIEEKDNDYSPESASPKKFYDTNVIHLLSKPLKENYQSDVRLKKDVKFTVDLMERILDKTESFIESMISINDAIKALWKASSSLSQNEIHFAQLMKKGEINEKKLKKYEKVIDTFKRKIIEQRLDLYPKINVSYWTEKALGHNIDIIEIETKKSLHQFPSLSVHPHKLYTNIERLVIPSFYAFKKIDESYFHCTESFERFKTKSGLLRKPPKELEEEAYNSLKEFCKNYGSLVASYEYSSQTYKKIRYIERHNIKRKRGNKTLKELRKQIIMDFPDESIKDSEIYIRQIHAMIDWINNISIIRK
jgi:hypothetical protein